MILTQEINFHDSKAGEFIRQNAWFFTFVKVPAPLMGTDRKGAFSFYTTVFCALPMALGFTYLSKPWNLVIFCVSILHIGLAQMLIQEALEGKNK